jgi:ribosome-associated translation inhibitor RaiA
MRFKIITRHFELPNEFKDLMRKKYQHLFHYSNRIMSGWIVIESDGSDYHLEFFLKLRGSDLTVHTRKPNLLVGINNLYEKMKRRLKKEEELIKEHRLR